MLGLNLQRGGELGTFGAIAQRLEAWSVSVRFQICRLAVLTLADDHHVGLIDQYVAFLT